MFTGNFLECERKITRVEYSRSSPMGADVVMKYALDFITLPPWPRTFSYLGALALSMTDCNFSAVVAFASPVVES
jgi:hypothetical protein